MAQTELSFDQVVFSGGGIRCFWHGGFLSEVGSYSDLSPERITGVSGGALSGAAWIGEVEQDLLTLMQDAFTLTDSNFDRRKSRFTPHQELYRAVVSTTLDDKALVRIADGPDFHVLLTVPPKLLAPSLAAFVGISVYKSEQHTYGSPHLGWGQRIGFTQMRMDARQAARDGRLVDLIVAAATIPPVFTVPVWDGRPVLDGGILDKAAMPEPDIGTSLILLTSHYRNVPNIDGRSYVQPSQAVAADKIDFTSDVKVADTWAQGATDAREWLAKQAPRS